MPVFTVYDSSKYTLADLTDAMLAANSGLTVSSIVLKASAPDAVNFYDGTLAPLGIGAGLLLTSGTTPGTTNTVDWFGTDNMGAEFFNGDADIDAVVNAVFQTQSYDATTLSFDVTAGASDTSISFDLVFGSDEFPEWVDQFVDCAIFMVNGVNYALFNHDPMHPLSVVSSNLAAGYFQDNASNLLPIEYDGVSHVLKIVAPINPGSVNHIKIGIADTGDHIYDSGIFITNLSAGTIPGSGVVTTSPASCSDGPDTVTGSAQDEYFDLKGGDDILYAGAGDDIAVGGAGKDKVYGGSGSDQIKGDAGDDEIDGGDGDDTAVYTGSSASYTLANGATSGSYTITDNGGPASEGTDSLKNVELAKFSDGLFKITATGLEAVTGPGPAPTNTPGLVTISGIGAEGKTLTATVSDADGVPGTVTYQWQVSGDGGNSWSNVGSDSKDYTVAVDDVGRLIQVQAAYSDGDSHPETPVSAPKLLQTVNNGDLVVTLMQLDAPFGASTINPLTTLVNDAIDFGLSPNTAALVIKTVLGLPSGINLQSYDAYAVLDSDPSEPTALAVETVAVQVAILTSLSDDDQGTKLTLAILDAAAKDQTLDLGNLDDLSAILGVPATLDPITGKYPEPLNEILDRNKSMAEAIADGGDVGVIETEWQDLLSIQDGIASTSIADLSIHVNQAPTGSATGELAAGAQDVAYTLAANDLLMGFQDPEGDVLQVTGLASDSGSLADNGNGNGTWTFTPDPGFSGPVELSYWVEDGLGGAIAASQLFVVAPSIVGVDHPATGTLNVTGTAAEGSTLFASLDNAVDEDGGIDTTAFQWQEKSSGTWADLAGQAKATLTIPGDQSWVGLEVRVVATTTDAQGGTTVFEGSGKLIANVDDAATGVLNMGGLAEEGGSLSAVLTGLSDGDGEVVSTAYQWQISAGGTVWTDLQGATALNVDIAADQSQVAHLLRVQITTTDSLGGSTTFTSEASQPVANVNDLPFGGIDISGKAEQGQTLVVDSSNLVDEDGLGTLGFQWLADGQAIAGATDAALTLGAALIGKKISAQASYVDGCGTSEAVTSAATDAVTKMPGLTLTGTSGKDILNGGDRDDLLDGLAGGDQLNGFGGDDRLLGGSGNDALKGGDGDDQLDGGLGRDALDGGAGVDTASYARSAKGVSVDLQSGKGSGGEAQGDTLTGIENLVGSAFADTLTGDAGANGLSGGVGNDVLRGLGGADRLEGGEGADRFVFTATGDSGLGATADLIVDFQQGSDRIDLSSIDANLLLRKDQAFSGALMDLATAFDAPGQLRFGYDAGNNTTIVQGDVNGDGAADFEIHLVGQINLMAADFVL